MCIALSRVKSMLAEECGLNEYLIQKGIDVVESDLGERILQLMHKKPSHIVVPAIHIKKEEIGELFVKRDGHGAGAAMTKDLFDACGT